MRVLGSEQFERLEFRELKLAPRMAGELRLVAALDRLSKLVLNSPESREFSDLATFGFFCRRSNVQRYLNSFTDLNQRAGLGLVTHIAPSNVPMNFAFSFVMGLISGNSNIVRLPTRSFPQIDVALRLIETVFEESEFSDLDSETVFFKSERGSQNLSKLISVSDGLVVWGGDVTVEHFRALRKKPLAREIYFGSRQSLAILDASHVAELNEDGLANLVSNFYNDTYVVDQNACSSPSMVFWLGSKQQAFEAASRFWTTLHGYVYENWMSWAPSGSEKLTDLFDFTEANDAPISLSMWSNALWVTSDDRARNSSLRLGYFLEKVVRQLRDIPNYLRDNEQTVTYFGVSPEELSAIFINQPFGRIERICPVGRALDMGFIWDGKDTLPLMSRRLSLH